MSNIIKFQSLDDETADQVNEEMRSTARFTPEGGRNIIRFLPARLGEKPLVVTAQHWIKLPGQQKATVFVCPRVQAKMLCPACERIDQLMRSGSSVDKALAEEMMARKSIHANVINRRDPDRGPLVYTFGKMIHQQLEKIRKNTDPNFAGGDYMHPTEGLDILVNKEGEGREHTKYTVQAAIKPTPLHVDATIASKWIQEQEDLRQLARVPDADHIISMLGGNTSRPAADVGPVPAAPPKGPTVQDAIDAEFE